MRGGKRSFQFVGARSQSLMISLECITCLGSCIPCGRCCAQLVLQLTQLLAKRRELGIFLADADGKFTPLFIERGAFRETVRDGRRILG